MGNSKLLIIAISVLSAMALICVSAFAEDLTPEINFPPFEQGDIIDPEEVVRDVVNGSDTSVPFNFLEHSYYLYSDYSLAELPTATAPVLISSVSVYDSDGNFVIGSSGSLSNFYVFSIDSDLGYFYNGSYVVIPGMGWGNFNSFSFYFTSPSSTLQLRNEVVFGSLVVEEPVNDFWNTIRGVGNSILSFVMSSWVVLVPVVAFVLVLGITVIRRLTNGV